MIFDVIDKLLYDKEDLCVKQVIKLINSLVKFKLVTKERILKILPKILPYLLYPNK